MRRLELIRDEVCRFDTTRGLPGIFHLQVLKARLRWPIAVCGELADNPGPSVTNAAESVATHVAALLGTRWFYFIEHYPWFWGDSPDEGRPNYTLVTFRWARRVGAVDPRWRRPSFDPGYLLRAQVDLRTWSPRRYTAKAVGGIRGEAIRVGVALEADEWHRDWIALLGEHGVETGGFR